MTKRLFLLLVTLLSLPCWGQPTLLDLDGQPVPLRDASPEVTMLVSWCSHCQSCRELEAELAEFSRENAGRVRVAAVSAHPADSPERVRSFLAEHNLPLEVLRDPNGTFMKSLDIRKTTTAAVYDAKGALRYLGPFKDQEAKWGPQAVTDLLSGRQVRVTNRPQRGCPVI